MITPLVAGKSKLYVSTRGGVKHDRANGRGMAQVADKSFKRGVVAL
jgi:hypothetical protein